MHQVLIILKSTRDKTNLLHAMWHITHASSLSLYSMISSDANCESLGLGFLLGTGSLGGLLARLRLGRGRHRLDAFVAFPGQRLPFQSGDVSVIRVLFPLQLTKKLCKSLPIHLPHHLLARSSLSVKNGITTKSAIKHEEKNCTHNNTRNKKKGRKGASNQASKFERFWQVVKQ